MQTKIVLTGSFSVGKTTLLNLFKDQSYIVPEVAREMLVKNPTLMEKPEFQSLILREQIKREKEAEKNADSLIVFDRGTIDVVAYCRYFKHKEPQIYPHYDKVFLCSPKGVPCVYGQESEEMRQNLHIIFLSVLRDFQIPYIMLEGNPQERFSIIQSELLFLTKEGGRNPYEKR